MGEPIYEGRVSMKNYTVIQMVTPTPQKEITRETCCDKFVGRRCLFPSRQNCWFCQFAWFEAGGDELPEKGSCCYPRKQVN